MLNMSDIVDTPRTSYYLENRETLLQRAKDRYKQHREKYKQYNHDYYKRNKEVINTIVKERRKRRPQNPTPPPRMIVKDNTEDIVLSFN